MGFKFSKRSLDNLAMVDPRMRKIVERAIQISEVDFVVGQGLRTRDDQARLYGQGRAAAEMTRLGLPAAYAKPAMQKVTWTMNSNHLDKDGDGYGEAVDLWVWHEGAINWKRIDLYKKIAVAMKQAAMELCTPIAWGGDWNKVDYPHYELRR